MGADLDIREFSGKLTRGELTKAWAEAREEARSEDGDSAYSGTIATLEGGLRFFEDSPRPTVDKAHDKIAAGHPKWSAAWAVKATKTTVDRVAYDKATAKARTALDAREQARAGILAAFKAKASPALLKCTACGSRLARTHLAGLACPLCRGSLLGKRDQAKLARVEADVVKANEAVNEARKGKASGDEVWVVGGWCSS